VTTRVIACLGFLWVAVLAGCGSKTAQVQNDTDEPLRVRVVWPGAPSVITGSYGVGPGASTALIMPGGTADLSSSHIDTTSQSSMFGRWQFRAETEGRRPRFAVWSVEHLGRKRLGFVVSLNGERLDLNAVSSTGNIRTEILNFGPVSTNP